MEICREEPLSHKILSLMRLVLSSISCEHQINFAALLTGME